MPEIGSIRRRELIRALRKLGLEGPYKGTRHQVMERGETTVRIPNPHRGDISTGLLAEILRQAGISKEEWRKL